MGDFDRLIIRRKRIDLSVARSLKEQAITFTHCRIDASTNAATASLRLHSTDNEPITVFNGRRLKNFKVDKLYIDNAVQAGEWIDLIFWGGPVMGPPEINDDALTAQIAGAIQIDDSNPVDVDVITFPDHLKVRTDAAQEFMQGANSSAVASQYGHVQLWNPAASGKILVVRRALGVDRTNVAVMYMRRSTTALATLSIVGENKEIGGAVGVGETRIQNNASFLGASSTLGLITTDDSFAGVEFIKDAPLMIPANAGVLIHSNVVNTFVRGLFEWSEI